jgi:dihydropteroate synthase
VIRGGTVARPRIFGILNVTPDSFSDGGNFFSMRDAIARAMELLADGADVIDVGGESTRPGATPVSAEEEIRRVVPVISEIVRSTNAAISIDTVKSEVARAALDAGATVINDVSGMRLDPAMVVLAADARCEVILMHSRGSVAEMATYALATYGGDPVGEIVAELLRRAEIAEQGGVERRCVILDPGIGFSKRSEHSLAVLREIPRLVETGYPVCLGVSRKRVVAEMIGEKDGRDAKTIPNEERDAKTAELNVEALRQGVTMFRVHNVKANRSALDAEWQRMRA